MVISIGIFLILFAQGLREAFMWMGDLNRLTNPLIKHKKGNGLIDYHPNRLIEWLGICLILPWEYYLIVIAFFPIYEVLETYLVRCDRLSFWESLKFQKSDWSFQSYSFNRKKWMPWWLKYVISIISLTIFLII